MLWCVMADFKPQLTPVIKSEHLFTLGLGPHTCGIWGKPSTTRHIGLNVCGRLFLRFLTHFCGFYHHLLLISFVEIFKKAGFNSLIHTFTFTHTHLLRSVILYRTQIFERISYFTYTLSCQDQYMVGCVDAKTYCLLIIIGIIGLRVSIKNFVTPLSRDLSFCHFQIT